MAMNIVYLIGNGFDLNLKMRTKYEHFYEYYLSACTDNNLSHIKELKKTIAKNMENWSDLEQSLGSYLAQVDNNNEAEELHDSLIEHLSTYIEHAENQVKFNKDQKGIFFNYLRNPHKFAKLLPTEESEINKYCVDSRYSNTVDIKLITFNYTKIIEKIIEKDSNPINLSIGQNFVGFNCTLSTIEHIHGLAKDRMILGVNDISQIANDKFHSITDITNRYIKSNCNNVYGLGHDDKCQQWINSAHLVCLFGLSFGITDKKWWVHVGKVLSRGCKVILFNYNPQKTFNGNQGPQLHSYKEAVKDIFLSQANISEKDKAAIKKNLYIAHNTDMFKLQANTNIGF